jgi:hypothetical protein
VIYCDLLVTHHPPPKISKNMWATSGFGRRHNVYKKKYPQDLKCSRKSWKTRHTILYNLRQKSGSKNWMKI